MSDLTTPAMEPEVAETQQTAQNKPQLEQLVKQLVKEQRYGAVAELFTDEATAKRLESEAMAIFTDICLPNLKDETHDGDFALYCCIEELLRLIAKYGPCEELLLELLEIIEECKSEVIFTSTLRAMQVLLLRFGETKTRALEWSLNSIHTRLEQLPLPPYLQSGYDEEQARLLEQDLQIQTLLTHYITVGLFSEPLLKDISGVERPQKQIFRYTGLNRRNILCSFLLSLLGKPLALLALTSDKRSTNSYTRQCARNLTEGVTQCIGDPFHFLTAVEYRMRWKGLAGKAIKPEKLYSSNIFLVEEKTPITAVAIYYFMLLVGRVSVKKVPKVYHPLFVFESILYLANALFVDEASVLHYRGMQLVSAGLEQLHGFKIPAASLELKVHKEFSEKLCGVMIYSNDVKCRHLGTKILGRYAQSFDIPGHYMLIRNLLSCDNHPSISGFLGTQYKNMACKSLLNLAEEMPAAFCGADFRHMMLECICKLPDGETTDVIEESEKILPALNIVRFFAIQDKHNRTGFWQLVEELEQKYLEPLQKALDISDAHYQAELIRVQKGPTEIEKTNQRTNAELVGIVVGNATSPSERNLSCEYSREQKIDVLTRSRTKLDLTRSLLGRVNECLELKKKFFNV